MDIWISKSSGSAACYLAGTAIATEHGEIPVEALSIGDRVRTHAGALCPIKWIGRRHYRPRVFSRSNPDVQPIRIAAGALADGVPVRDLYVSPLHALFIDGVLIPARRLVNGVSIRLCPDADPIHYVHIELDHHEIIFAEGAAAETFVDCDSRAMFHNAAEFAALYPGDVSPPWAFCAPRVERGPVLASIRAVINARAGLADDPARNCATTRDADVHVIAGGRVLRPAIRGREHRFQIPPGTQGVRLASRSAVPAEIQDDGADRRRVGVAVSRIVYGGTVIPLTDPRLCFGWHEMEHGEDTAWRWTDGEAGLALPGGTRPHYRGGRDHGLLAGAASSHAGRPRPRGEKCRVSSGFGIGRLGRYLHRRIASGRVSGDAAGLADDAVFLGLDLRAG